MNRRDENEVIDAIRKYTEPMLAEFRTYRAEVAAFAAQVVAFRAESRADFERLDAKFTDLDRDVAAISKRMFGEDDES